MTASNTSPDVVLFRRGDILSGESNHPINIDGVVWPTVEHYYQAARFSNPAIRDRIRGMATTQLAIKESQVYRHTAVKDWTRIRLGCLTDAFRAMFSQHDECRKHLLETGGAELYQLGLYDDYWGFDRNGRGQNQLGAVLAKLRDEFRSTEMLEDTLQYVD